MKYAPAQYRKAILFAATCAVNLVIAGVLTGTLALVVMAVVSALGVYGVFVVPNKP